MQANESNVLNLVPNIERLPCGLNRLILQTTQDATNTVIASYDYSLMTTGHRQQVTDHTGATANYGYDDLYRLIQETINYPVLGTVVNDYTYDEVGNRSYSKVSI